MANKKFWLGMLVIALVFGIVVIGCNNGTTGNENGGNNTTFTVSYDVGAGSGTSPASQNVPSGVDSDSTSSHADIVVDVYDSGLNLIRSNVDIGDGVSTTVEGNWDAGVWYFKVRPYNNNASNRGVFAITFT